MNFVTGIPHDNIMMISRPDHYDKKIRQTNVDRWTWPHWAACSQQKLLISCRYLPIPTEYMIKSCILVDCITVEEGLQLFNYLIACEDWICAQCQVRHSRSQDRWNPTVFQGCHVGWPKGPGSEMPSGKMMGQQWLAIGPSTTRLSRISATTNASSLRTGTFPVSNCWFSSSTNA